MSYDQKVPLKQLLVRNNGTRQSPKKYLNHNRFGLRYKNGVVTGAQLFIYFSISLHIFLINPCPESIKCDKINAETHAKSCKQQRAIKKHKLKHETKNKVQLNVDCNSTEHDHHPRNSLGSSVYATLNRPKKKG